MKPFYFLVVFWGEKYRDFFAQFCLASLLSDNNIVKMDNKSKSRFLICTTSADWQALQDYPIFLELKKYIEPQWIEFTVKENIEAAHDIMLEMSKGHRLLSETAFIGKACGIFVFPEMIVADGTVLALQKLMATGKYDLIETLSVRFATFELLSELKNNNIYSPNKPLTISSRLLMELGLKTRHTQLKVMDFGAQYKSQDTVTTHFEIIPNKAHLFHVSDLHPLLVDYSALPNHDVTTFETSTLDGNYISKNFQNEDRIYLSQDTDELMVVGFSDEKTTAYHLLIDHGYKYWLFSFFAKINYLRNKVFQSKMSCFIDQHKLFQFNKPILVRSCELNAWQIFYAKIKARIIIALAKKTPTVLEQFFMALYKIIYENENKFIKHIQENNNISFLNVEGVGTIHGFRLDLCLVKKKMYWEVHTSNFNLHMNATFSTGIVRKGYPLNTKIGLTSDGIGILDNGTILVNGIEIPSKEENLQIRKFMFAYDREQGLLWLGKDGSWLNEGDPSLGKNPTFKSINGEYFPAVSAMHTGYGSISCLLCLRPHDWSYEAPLGYGTCVSDSNDNPLPFYVVVSETRQLKLKHRFIAILEKIFSRKSHLLLYQNKGGC